MPPLIRRILFVDDDPQIRHVAQAALEEFGGFHVTACGSGEEAVRRAACAGPDLLLLDMRMPGMDGLATLAALRSLAVTARTPVIFMTGMTTDEDLAAYRSAGVIDVIGKPIDLPALARKIDLIWARQH